MRRVGVLISACLLATAAAPVAALAQDAEKGGGPPPLPVEAATVKEAPLVRSIQAVGSLRSGESVVIRPEVAGRIAEIAFEEGTEVAAGQLLVRLDAAAEKARLASAEAQLALSRANHKRALELSRRNNVSQAALEEAASRMSVDQAAVALARTAVDKSEIVAPFAGVVGLRQVSVGAYVAPGQDLVNLESLHPLKVDFRAPEIFATQLHPGQTVQISVDAVPGETFAGEVIAIDPRVDINGRAMMLRASVPNPDHTLRPGMFARVVLILEEKPDALMLPEQALVPQGRQQMVIRVEDGKAAYVPVRIGQRQGSEVEIVDGLSVGDTVVTAGQVKLHPGQPVMVLPGQTHVEVSDAGQKD
jgi:membrane fusion protein (multidrug efflux system)